MPLLGLEQIVEIAIMKTPKPEKIRKMFIDLALNYESDSD